MTPAQTRDALVAEMRAWRWMPDRTPTVAMQEWADRLAALPLSDESAEPWAGHHFAEHPGGIWRCVDKGCGFTIHAAQPPAAVPAWQPIATAPKDTMILVGPTKRMDICVAMNHSRDGWVTETCSEWSNIYTPTHWMPLPARPDAPAGEKGT